MTTRGVLYLIWGRKGKPEVNDCLMRSIQSVSKHHPGMKVKIEEVANGTLLDKARMYDLSPYDETLYLDCDTVVLGDLAFGFEKASRHGLACAVNEAPWARRYQKAITGDVIEYNTGVLFFSKSERTGLLFDAWKRLAKSADSSMVFPAPAAMGAGLTGTMPMNDQASFALAVEEQAFCPFVLPINWNFRARFQNIFYGPIKVWHDYTPPPPEVLARLEAQSKDGALLDFSDHLMLRRAAPGARRSF